MPKCATKGDLGEESKMAHPGAGARDRDPGIMSLKIFEEVLEKGFQLPCDTKSWGIVVVVKDISLRMQGTY